MVKDVRETHAAASFTHFGSRAASARETKHRPKKRTPRRRSPGQKQRIARGGTTCNCSRRVRRRLTPQSSAARGLLNGRRHLLLCEQGRHGRFRGGGAVR